MLIIHFDRILIVRLHYLHPPMNHIIPNIEYELYNCNPINPITQGGCAKIALPMKHSFRLFWRQNSETRYLFLNTFEIDILFFWIFFLIGLKRSTNETQTQFLEWLMNYRSFTSNKVHLFTFNWKRACLYYFYF